jgi:hypothetical protein
VYHISHNSFPKQFGKAYLATPPWRPTNYPSFSEKRPYTYIYVIFFRLNSPPFALKISALGPDQ